MQIEQNRTFRALVVEHIPWNKVKAGDFLEYPTSGIVTHVSVGKYRVFGGRLMREVQCVVSTIGANEVTMRMSTYATDKATILYPRLSMRNLLRWFR